MPDEPQTLGYATPDSDTFDRELPEGETSRALGVSLAIAAGIVGWSLAVIRVLLPLCYGCAPHSVECNRVEFWAVIFPAFAGVLIFLLVAIAYGRKLARRGYQLFYRSSDQRFLLIAHVLICCGMLIVLLMHDLSNFDD